jgi:hypothetical protein
MTVALIAPIIPRLRDAIGPVILISGVGLLLLTMTNRMRRAIDRARQLKNELTIASAMSGNKHLIWWTRFIDQQSLSLTNGRLAFVLLQPALKYD